MRILNIINIIIPTLLPFFSLINISYSSSVLSLDKKIFTSSSMSFSDINPIKPCSLCKWFIKREDSEDPEDGHCELFKKHFFLHNRVNNRFKHVKECRNNESLCGISAYYFEPNNVDKDKNDLDSTSTGKKNYLKELQYLREKMIEMEELNCGEVNENNDLENWDKEYKQIKNRIEKIINNSKEQ